MARTNLTAQAVTSAGKVATYAAANVDGNMFVCNDKRVLHVKNGSGASVTVTVVTDVTRDGDLTLPDREVAVAAGAEAFIGPFDPNVYQQTSGADAGKVYVNYSAVTTVTVALLEF